MSRVKLSEKDLLDLSDIDFTTHIQDKEEGTYMYIKSSSIVKV